MRGGSAELVGLEVAADGGEVEDEAEQVDCPGGPEGTVVAEVFGKQAAYEDPQTNAGIPGGQDGGVCGAALRVLGQVDEHSLESGVHVAVSQTYYKSCSIITDGVVQGGKQQVAEYADRYAHRGVAGYLVLTQRMGAGKS